VRAKEVQAWSGAVVGAGQSKRTGFWWEKGAGAGADRRGCVCFPAPRLLTETRL
jgi:hypothetical protein